MYPMAAERPSSGRSVIRKEIVQLAWPVIAEQVLTTLANMVDAILVGRLGPVAVAAIGLSQQPHWLMVGLFAGLGVGVNALVARFYGAGETDRIEPATRAGFWVGLLCSVVAGLAIFASSDWIMAAVGAEADVAPLGAEFLRLLAPGMVAVMWSMVVSAALRATGDTRSSLYINFGVNVINAVLAFGLIYGHFGLPVMGLAGAALATTIARFTGAAALFAVLLRRDQGARLRWRSLFSIEWDLVRRILKIGSLSSSERIFSTLVYIAYARMVAALGTVSVAAHTISIVAENITWYLASGFSMATAAMVGQRLGARLPEEAEAVIGEANRLCMALLGAVGLVFIAFPQAYVSIFTNDPNTVALSASVIRIAGFAEIATAYVLVLNGALSGAGDTRPLFFVNAGGGIVRIGIGAVLIFGLGWGLQGAWIAASCDWIVRSGLIWLRYRSGAWKAIRV